MRAYLTATRAVPCLSHAQMFVTFPNWDEFVATPMIRAGGNPYYVILAFFALMVSQLLHTVGDHGVQRVCSCVCVCVCACGRVCVWACVRACVCKRVVTFSALTVSLTGGRLRTSTPWAASVR